VPAWPACLPARLPACLPACPLPARALLPFSCSCAPWLTAAPGACACRRALQDTHAQLLHLRPLLEAAAGAAAHSAQALQASGAGPAASGWLQQPGGGQQAAQQGPAGSARGAELPSPSGADTPDQPPEQQQEQQQEEASCVPVDSVQPAALPGPAARQGQQQQHGQQQPEAQQQQQQQQEQEQQEQQRPEAAAVAAGGAEVGERQREYPGLPGLLLYTSSGTSSASGQQQQGQQEQQGQQQHGEQQAGDGEAMEVDSPSRPGREQQGPPANSPGLPGPAQPTAAQRPSPPPASGAQGLLLELSPPGAAECRTAPDGQAEAEADAALQTLLTALAGGDGAQQPEWRLQVQAAMQQTSSLVAQLRAENQALRLRVEGVAAAGGARGVESDA
jgi:hypothetical protein